MYGSVTNVPTRVFFGTLEVGKEIRIEVKKV